MDDYKYASVRRNVMKQKQHLGVSTHPRVCGFASEVFIKKLAMPKIGCGLDRCSWMEVESIILDVFDGTDIDITVCVL